MAVFQHILRLHREVGYVHIHTCLVQPIEIFLALVVLFATESENAYDFLILVHFGNQLLSNLHCAHAAPAASLAYLLD